MTEPVRQPPRLAPLLVVVGLALYAAAGLGMALLETLLVPLRHGSTLVPITVPLAIMSNIALPKLARRLNDTLIAAAVPAVAWMVTVVVFLSSRREGDVLLPASPSDVMYTGYAMFFGGIIAAVATITLIPGSPKTRDYRPRGERPPRDSGATR